MSRHRHASLAMDEFAEFSATVLTNPGVMFGTPGNVTIRKTTSGQFYYRQYYSLDGKKRDEYVAPVGTTEGEAARARVQEFIEARRSACIIATKLRQHGFAHMADEACLDLLEQQRAGHFNNGMYLIGRHAIGAWMNTLGLRLGARASNPFVEPMPDNPLFASNNVSHIFLPGVAVSPLAPELVSALAINPASLPVFSKKLVAVVALPSPEFLCIVEIVRPSSPCRHLPGELHLGPELRCLLQYILEHRKTELVHSVGTLPDAARYVVEKAIAACSIRNAEPVEA